MDIKKLAKELSDDEVAELVLESWRIRTQREGFVTPVPLRDGKELIELIYQAYIDAALCLDTGFQRAIDIHLTLSEKTSAFSTKEASIKNNQKLTGKSQVHNGSTYGSRQIDWSFKVKDPYMHQDVALSSCSEKEKRVFHLIYDILMCEEKKAKKAREVGASHNRNEAAKKIIARRPITPNVAREKLHQESEVQDDPAIAVEVVQNELLENHYFIKPSIKELQELGCCRWCGGQIPQTRRIKDYCKDSCVTSREQFRDDIRKGLRKGLLDEVIFKQVLKNMGIRHFA